MKAMVHAAMPSIGATAVASVGVCPADTLLTPFEGSASSSPRSSSSSLTSTLMVLSLASTLRGLGGAQGSSRRAPTDGEGGTRREKDVPVRRNGPTPSDASARGADQSLRDTDLAMSEESTTPDPAELAGRSFAAAGRHDIDALMSFYAADAVWDMSGVGVGHVRGHSRRSEGSSRTGGRPREDHHQEIRDFRDFGNGVLFAAIQEDSRLPEAIGRVEHTRGWVAYGWTA